MDQPEEETQQVSNLFEGWSSEDWNSLIKQIGETMLQLNTLRMNEKKTISWPIIGLIALIFMSVVYLAGNGQIEGHYVTSMGGVIVGYLLSFLGETVSPPQSS